MPRRASLTTTRIYRLHRGGNSVTLRCITCQMLHYGSLAFVLDTKRISHPWARGTPGVT